MGFPLSRGGLARADDAADLLAVFGLFWRGVNDQQQHGSDKPDRMPTIAIRMRVRSRSLERIGKHKRRGFERQTVLEAVCRRLAAALPGSQVQRTCRPSMSLQIWSYIGVVSRFPVARRAPGQDLPREGRHERLEAQQPRQLSFATDDEFRCQTRPPAGYSRVGDSEPDSMNRLRSRP